MTQTKTGPDLLAEWIALGGRKHHWVAAQIRVDRSALTAWLKGSRAPQAVYRDALERLTKGAVPVEAWSVE